MNEEVLHGKPLVVHDTEHAAHEPHHQSFITKYIFSQDHKMISKQYMVTCIIWAVICGFFSVIFRLHLGFPDQTFPFLEDIFGHWAKGGRLDTEFYYALVTMHGTILVFFVLTAGLSGTFSNFLIPLQIGARDMASPFINMLSYWVFFIASVFMFSSLFLQTGPASGGWTIYPPLSALGDAMDGSKAGMDFWLTSIAFFIISVLLGGLNYITTVLNLRTKGMYMTRLPLTVWSFLFTAILGVLTFPVLLSAVVLLLFDRHLGTSFYLSDIVIGGKILPNEGGSPILFQHLFWFLGHPEVYIIALPAMGITSEVISTNARKPIFGYMAMVGSFFAIASLSFLVWAHHMFVTGMNPFLGSFFVLFTLLIAVPSSIKTFNWLTTLWRGNIRFTPAMLFAIGFVSLFISGGLTGIWLGNSALDFHLHDTYFVIAHFHLVMGVASMFGMFAGIYHWYPKMFGRMMNNTLAYLHFWISLVGAYFIFWPMHYEGLAGMPRRYYDFSNWESFKMFSGLNAFISVTAIIVFAAQFLFIFNFFYSMYKGRKLTEKNKNPWHSCTMEWTTPIHPPHGNWTSEIPEVHRWPYDYGKDGRDFIAQTEPVGADETKH
jgi:cytochrome c oxidase subunit 1